MDAIKLVSVHAEGEVGNVIVGGVTPPPGDSLFEQRDWLARDGTLHRLMLNEPRGGVFTHVNLLVPPKDPRAVTGFLIMEPTFLPPMSGSNAICVATVCLETGVVPMVEPETVFYLEAPAGLVEIRATCRRGKAEAIEIANVASFADKLDAPLEVEGVGTLLVDTAWGGDSYCIVDAGGVGFEIVPSEGADIAAMGAKITKAANEQIGFSHPDLDWNFLSFCQFAGYLSPDGNALTGRNAVVIDPGKIDRSPCGTGSSARMAVLHARGQMQLGGRYISRSIIGGRFECRIAATTEVAGRPAILPMIKGRAWITGTSDVLLHPSDPWPEGYRVADTWPNPT